MSSTFTSFANGDVIEASHVAEMHTPIQNLERGAAFYAGASAGTSTAYTATMTPAPDNPYQAGMMVNFKVHVQNTAGSPDVTLNVNGVGAKPIKKNGGVSLAAGDLKADQIVSVILDPAGSQTFQLISVSSVSALDDLSDVVISSPASGQVVRYNGSNFANASLAAGDMPGGIDAAKIGGGAVSNTEFSYLDGVTGALQTQINGKAASSHTHAASDINSGQLALAQGGTAANLSATGGTGQFLKQSSAGAAVTVAALTATDMPGGIDAAKIGGGAVSNTEFGYLDGVTGALQTQINGKATSSHTHAASDINSGQLALAQGGTAANLSATGGTGQFLKQSSAGAAVTVAALTATDMPGGIDAAKIGGGAVSNTEFGYLDGVTSALQTQLTNLGLQTGALQSLLYGDGSDGDVTISSNTSLTEPKFYNNLTVNSGVTLDLRCFPIYVKGTLTLNGTISCDGKVGVSSAGGLGSGNSDSTNSYSRWHGANGGDGGVSLPNGGGWSARSTPFDTSALFTANGGNGGNDSYYYGGSGSNTNLTYILRWIQGLPTLFSGLYDGPVLKFTDYYEYSFSMRLRGGLGGGGGGVYAYSGSSNGGPGGGGGGVLRVFARTLAGSGTLAARGANGGNGYNTSGGGGGGGAGGAVLLVSSSTSHSYTLTAPGGSGGTGCGGASAGSAGSTGFTKFYGGI